MKVDPTDSKELRDLISDENARGLLLDLMMALPGIVAVLSEDRKLVFSNQALLDTVSISNFEEAFQLLPGELFKCVNSNISPDGCGSSEACQLCGALRSMEDSRESRERITNDCRILSKVNDKTISYNFRFTSTPFFNEDNMYFVVTIEDISGQTRKAELEKIFFHDVINSLSGMQGVIKLLKDGQDFRDLHLEILEESYKSLFQIIKEQKELNQAESGELDVVTENLSSHQIIEDCVLPFKLDDKYVSKIELRQDSDNFDFISDSGLLSRILTNMLKNALEASGEYDVVKIWSESDDQGIAFCVGNPGFIPRAHQLQIFERSFTTKGSGRGLGTFSMKLLGENYLSGKVDFSSDEKKGTVFSIRLPR